MLPSVLLLVTFLIAPVIVAAIIGSRFERKQTFAKNASGTVAFKRKLHMKVRRPGFKEPILEQEVGDDLHRDSGRWMKQSRRIDRLRDWYHEKFTDSKTGRIVYERKLSNRKRHL